MEVKKYPLEPDPRVIQAPSASDDLYVTLKIGNGQIGGSKIKNGEETIAKGDLSSPTHIGKAADLNHATLTFRTNVVDMNPFNNKCVVTTTVFNQDHVELFSKTDNGDAPEDGMASFVGNYLIKLTVALLFFTGILSTDAFAQEDLSFESLETPASPGFILLDETPSSIERPTTPQGLGISALGIFSGGGGAIEFAPFWLTNHPNLTAKKMRDKHGEIFQNFAISGAHIQKDSMGYMATGFRTRLYKGFSKDQKADMDHLENEIIQIAADIDDDSTPEDFKKLDSLRKKYIGTAQKPVFSVDIAGAIAGSSATNSYNDLRLSRWAL